MAPRRSFGGGGGKAPRPEAAALRARLREAGGFRPDPELARRAAALVRAGGAEPARAFPTGAEQCPLAARNPLPTDGSVRFRDSDHAYAVGDGAAAALSSRLTSSVSDVYKLATAPFSNRGAALVSVDRNVELVAAAVRSCRASPGEFRELVSAWPPEALEFLKTADWTTPRGPPGDFGTTGSFGRPPPPRDLDFVVVAELAAHLAALEQSAGYDGPALDRVADAAAFPPPAPLRAFEAAVARFRREEKHLVRLAISGGGFPSFSTPPLLPMLAGRYVVAWNATGQLARDSGTELHAAVERFYQGREDQADEQMLRDHGFFELLHKYPGLARENVARVEFLMAWPELRLAGCCDALFFIRDEEDAGKIRGLWLVDWKRSDKLLEPQSLDADFAYAFPDFRGPGGGAATKADVYSLQLELYARILEQHPDVPPVLRRSIAGLHPALARPMLLTYGPRREEADFLLAAYEARVLRPKVEEAERRAAAAHAAAPAEAKRGRPAPTSPDVVDALLEALGEAADAPASAPAAAVGTPSRFFARA